MLHMPSRNPSTPIWTPSATPSVPRTSPNVLPRVNQRLVEPETRQEMIDGHRVLAAPALPAHGDAHCQLDSEAAFHIRSEYVASTDLLTRVNWGSDFATDTSIRKAGVDPATGDRYLEEISFEVVHEQTKRSVTERAESLSWRGVRRVFAIFVKRGEVAEWVPDDRSWRTLPEDSEIDDECLIRPLPVKALLDRAEGRNAVARVLIDEHNPVIEQVREDGFRSGHRDGVAEGRRQGVAEGRRQGVVEGRRQGVVEGRRQGIEQLCGMLGLELTDEQRARLEPADSSGHHELTGAAELSRGQPS